MPTDITFSQDQKWNASRTVVAFHARQNLTPIMCHISKEALLHTFAASNDDLIQRFLAHRGTIETMAERLISQARFEPDGSIFIRDTDRP